MRKKEGCDERLLNFFCKSSNC